LRGPAAPRRGTALEELGIVQDGAVLIRDGRIEDLGQGRRVENLAIAREIDVTETLNAVVASMGLGAPAWPLVTGDTKVVDKGKGDGLFRSFPVSAQAVRIGQVVTDRIGQVILRSRIGGTRVFDMLSGEQLPRVC
jgi:hydrogenase maturation factor